jgi:hypothetical protein
MNLAIYAQGIYGGLGQHLEAFHKEIFDRDDRLFECCDDELISIALYPRSPAARSGKASTVASHMLPGISLTPCGVCSDGPSALST